MKYVPMYLQPQSWGQGYEAPESSLTSQPSWIVKLKVQYEALTHNL